MPCVINIDLKRLGAREEVQKDKVDTFTGRCKMIIRGEFKTSEQKQKKGKIYMIIDNNPDTTSRL